MRTNWGLVLAFDTDSPDFVRGCEVGLVYERLRVADENHEDLHVTVSDANAEMMIRLAESFGYCFSAAPLDDGWMAVSFMWERK